ncbi:MAG: ABC transporter ATP-binding protein [Granulosicoccaceae bacterium]
MSGSLLKVQDLQVAFHSNGKIAEVVRGVSFDIQAGQTLALVGESGSGKSVTARSIMRLLPYPAASHPGGEVFFKGEPLLRAPERRMRQLRGEGIGMIFQEPMTSLNPLHTIEKQITEVLQVHKGIGGRAARDRTLELLDWVGIRDAQSRLGSYPHQLSGGQRQRVMIAMALANEPELLIADEPTTALDVTVEVQILDLLQELQARLGMALLLITHDLAVVQRMADKICVMRDGVIVEAGGNEQVFQRAQHPYTQHLLDAEPQGSPAPLPAQAPVQLKVEQLKVHFPIKGGLFKRTVSVVKAVDGADFELRAGETLGVVGESGSGKSTLAQAVLRLISSEGSVAWLGDDIQGWKQKNLRPLRADMQLVFQDPFGALSPRMTVGQLIGEGLGVHQPLLSEQEVRAKVAKALQDVELDPSSLSRYPHEFSGGQRQRIAIARAIVLEPKLIVLDEPTSALDRSIQSQVLDLLQRLQRERGLSYIFISHDLKVVRTLSHQLLVMRAGEVVEHGDADKIFKHPRSEYTLRLLQAAFERQSSEHIAL